MLASLPGTADPDDQHRLGRQVDHPRAALPLLLREVVLESTREGEQERHGVGREVLVVAAAHVRHDDGALHERVVEPVAAQARAGGADPAQLPGAGEELGRHRPVGGVGVLDVGEGVLRIPEGLGDRAGDGLSDLLRPRLVDVRGQQHDLEAHGLPPLRTVGGRDLEFPSALTRITISPSIGTDPPMRRRIKREKLCL